MPLVTVIVPVYNAYPTLARCVKSVLAQTQPELELILVDDGSTDASGGLCDALALADSRIRVLHKENGGVSAARNAGLKAASGQWLVFLDADDYMSPFALEAALFAADKAPGSLVLWQATYWDEGLPAACPHEGERFGLEKLAWMQRINCLPMPWNKLFSLPLIRQQGLRFDPDYSLGEDLLFCLSYCKALLAQGGSFYLIKAHLTFYEQGCANSLTGRLRPDYFSLWQSIYIPLLDACETEFHCPAEDLAGLRQGAAATISQGACRWLLGGEGSRRDRRQQVKAVLRDPWLRDQLRKMAQDGEFSLYELGIRLASPGLLLWAFRLWQKDGARFTKLQYLGRDLRRRLSKSR